MNRYAGLWSRIAFDKRTGMFTSRIAEFLSTPKGQQLLADVARIRVATAEGKQP
mgnify:CR=1 FL=1